MRRKHLVVSVLVIVVTLLWAFTAFAGSPDSPGAPGATSSYTLEDIYNRLDAGTAGTQSTFTEPAAGPGTGTMHTLNDIMAKAPAADDPNGARADQVVSGKTFWGLQSGAWGSQTGTMTDNGAVTITPGSTQQTIAAGYHNGTGYVEGDADLVGDNILQGKEIFGINGTLGLDLNAYIIADGEWLGTDTNIPVGRFVGEIVWFARNPGFPAAPGNAIPCDGRTLAILEYPTLYATLSTTYGGNGTTTFAVPNLTNTPPVGK